MNSSKMFVFLFLCSAVVVAFLVSRSGPNSQKETVKEVSEESLRPEKMHKVSSFELINQENKKYSTKQLEGKLWVADFIFTRCQGPCPLITQKMQSLQEIFKEDEGVRFLSITMDPDHDKAEQLKAFGQKFNADFTRWNFLTGEQDKILDIARNIFKVPADKNPEMHSTRFVLIDSSSHMRGYYNSLEPESLKKLIADIKQIRKKDKVNG